MKRVRWFLVVALMACGGSDDVIDDVIDAALVADDARPDAPSNAKRIFITSIETSGAFGGLEGADITCSIVASGADLGGAWKAWLSDAGNDAIDRIADTGPWYDAGGLLIFASRAQLMDSPSNGLSVDETGNGLATGRIWTATGAGGVFASPDGDCGGWTSQSNQDTARVGQVGRSDGDAWTAFTAAACSQDAHLLCLEQ